jgi:NTP pyrophosphatase (non-canonical NTP hydrolase)
MADGATTVEQLKQAMARFVAEREWERFHSPKNLVMGLSVEAAELMEHFLWMGNEESRTLAADDMAKRIAIGEEMADVACYLLALANSMQLDLSAAISDKLAKNAIKYPAEQYKGRYERSSGA